MLQVLASTIKQEKEREWIHLRNEYVKLSLFTNNMTLCLKDPNASSSKLLVLINIFSKVTWHKTNIQKLMGFVDNDRHFKKEVREPISFT